MERVIILGSYGVRLHVTIIFINMVFNKEDSILINSNITSIAFTVIARFRRFNAKTIRVINNNGCNANIQRGNRGRNIQLL